MPQSERPEGETPQREVPQRRTPQQWATLVQEYEASGESQRAFCAERGIGQSSLRYWRRRLEEGRDNAGAPGARTARLVAVKLIEETPALAASGLVVVTARGVRIEVARDFDAAVLARVVAALEAAA